MKIKKLLLSAALCALCLLLASCAFFRKGKGTDAQNGAEDEQGGKTVEQMIDEKNHLDAEVVHEGVSYAKNPAVKAYLFAGIDKAGDLATADRLIGGQCDTLLLLVTDSDAKQYTILQLHRDTMAQVEITDFHGKPVRLTTQQICFAHTYGNGTEKSAENTVRAVSRLLGGMEIDGYITMQYEGIPGVNDAVGGIRVKIEDDFSDSDPTLIQGETVELTGTHALRYLRARMSVGDGTNVSRMRRQSTYLKAFTARVKQEMRARSALINDMYDAAAPYMVTDMSLGEIAGIAAKLADYTDGGIVTPKGEAKEAVYSNGKTYVEYYVDEDDLSRIVLDLFYQKV